VRDHRHFGVASTSKRLHSRLRAVSAITTTALAISQSPPAPVFGGWSGRADTVWATTMQGRRGDAGCRASRHRPSPRTGRIVLHDHGVAIDEDGRRLPDRRRARVVQLGHYPRVRRRGPVGHAHHAHLGPVGLQAARQGGSKGGQAARCRRVSAQNPEGTLGGAGAPEQMGKDRAATLTRSSSLWLGRGIEPCPTATAVPS